ncbi:MAG: DNA-deoxyinosine glycosylase [Sphingomicrobium sp.]
MLNEGFPPIANADTRIFILGSLPGKTSLEEGRYYAYHGNQFWKLVGAAAGQDLHSLDYPARLAALADRGIGLWDVIGAAYREGSLDSAIKSPRHNELGGLRAAYPRLEAIAFNGGRAAKDGRRLLAGVEDIILYDLISSSGAAARPFPEKAAIWSVIARHLN